MTDAINAVLTFFQSIASIGKNFLEGVFSLLALIPQGIAFITSTIGFIPSAISIFAIVGISIAVVLLVLGR